MLCEGKKKSTLDLANQCRCSYSEVIAKTKAGKQRIHEISFGYRKARLQVLASTLLQKAKRIFGIPDSRLHALSDGLRRLFLRHPGKHVPTTVQTDHQLYFENFAPYAPKNWGKSRNNCG